MKRYRTHEAFRDALPQHLERRAAELRAALVAVFHADNTHSLPTAMRAIPAEWAREYRAVALELGVPPDLERADALVGTFLNDILADNARGTWDPGALRWTEDRIRIP